MALRLSEFPCPHIPAIRCRSTTVCGHVTRSEASPRHTDEQLPTVYYQLPTLVFHRNEGPGANDLYDQRDAKHDADKPELALARSKFAVLHEEKDVEQKRNNPKQTDNHRYGLSGFGIETVACLGSAQSDSADQEHRQPDDEK